MEQDFSQLMSLLTRRLAILRLLADEIRVRQDACVALDFEALPAHDRQTARLCAEVCRLDRQIAALRQQPACEELIQSLRHTGRSGRKPSSEWLAPLRKICLDSQAACAEVSRLNLVYAAFLDRARSTLTIMRNIMSHCLGVYPPAGLIPDATFSAHRSH